MPEELAGAERGIGRIGALAARLTEAQESAAAHDRGPCDLRELCQRVAAEQEAVLGCPVALDLPVGPVTVTAAPLRITQVLVNLLGNGARHGAPPFTVSLRREGAEAVVAVRDRGPGVPPEALPRLFDAFYRANPPGPARPRDRPGSGLGLGLYICRRIVEEHGGRIWVEAPPGGGSAFLLALPAA